MMNDSNKKTVGQAIADLAIDLGKIAIAGTAAVFVAKAIEDNWGEASTGCPTVLPETASLPVGSDADAANLHALTPAEFEALYG